jgi:outer membrane protein assembly factor BamB
MDRRLALLAVICLIVVALSAYLILPQLTPKPTYITPDAKSIVWQNELKDFVGDFTVADGRVFTAETSGGGLYCFEENSGRYLWNQSQSGTQIATYNGRIYLATKGLIVNRFDDLTGKLEMQYGVPGEFDFAYKWTPIFSIADGKLFASYGNDIAVFDLATNKELWHSYMAQITSDANTTLPESDYPFIQYNSNAVATYRFNPDNGNKIWNYSGYTESPIISQQKVILWNYVPRENIFQGILPQQRAIIGLNLNSGDKLWEFDTNTTIFQPIAYNDMVLFNARDGFFYALNITDGTLKWKINVDNYGLIAGLQSTAFPDAISRTSEPLVDKQSQTLFWTFTRSDIVKHYAAEENSNAGIVLALDLQSANIKWYTPINSSLACVGNGHMALLNNHLFISDNAGLLCLNANTGDAVWERSFDHYVNSPLVADNKVFVAADTFIIAYK